MGKDKLPKAEELARHTGLGRSAARQYLRKLMDKDNLPAVEIVAGVITNGQRFGLVRRSMAVTSDQGLWHCVTGFVESGHSPQDQMLDELSEELGLFESEVTELKWVSSISIVEDETRWLIHVFLIITEVEDFHLNWENDGFCWIKPGEYMRDSVSWLTTVLAEVEGLKGDG